MKKFKAVKFLGIILIIVSLLVGLVGCNLFMSSSDMLDLLAESLAMSLMGSDAFAWNVFSVNPKVSYGAELQDNPTWYSYTPISQEDLSDLCTGLQYYQQLLAKIKTNKLSESEMITYRSLEDSLNDYLSLYSSPHAAEFILINGSYITSDGGYVAEFASTVENYSFRNETDVKHLLSMLKSTEEAFATYVDYAAARANAGMPLYDYTLNSMQEYLNGITELGENYYLYSFIEHKIDAVNFLTADAKAAYITSYKTALTNNFMDGVQVLSQGLGAYKGRVAKTEKSYLAAYGEIGREFYEWNFAHKTGIRNANLNDVYNELVTAYTASRESMQSALDSAKQLETANKAAYDEFKAYYDGEKVYLDLTTPEDIIDYLKDAAKNIVPDLKVTPEIGFKYLDSTVEQISPVLAYYLRSPMDDTRSPESITLNGYRLAEEPSELLTTIAHEGYPGHLYAHVREKEQGVKLITTLSSSLAFTEGWAMYVELAVINNIAAETNSEALKLYCEYDTHRIVAGYLNSVIYDMQVNYFGKDAAYYVANGYEEARAQELIEAFMEDPSVYVSYGYGVYYMRELHDYARESLGEAYNEIEFNGKLLSEGSGPTLARAKVLTEEYINSKR